jgi:hypothetical protein
MSSSNALIKKICPKASSCQPTTPLRQLTLFQAWKRALTRTSKNPWIRVVKRQNKTPSHPAKAAPPSSNNKTATPKPSKSHTSKQTPVVSKSAKPKAPTSIKRPEPLSPKTRKTSTDHPATTNADVISTLEKSNPSLYLYPNDSTTPDFLTLFPGTSRPKVRYSSGTPKTDNFSALLLTRISALHTYLKKHGCVRSRLPESVVHKQIHLINRSLQTCSPVPKKKNNNTKKREQKKLKKAALSKTTVTAITPQPPPFIQAITSGLRQNPPTVTTAQPLTDIEEPFFSRARKLKLSLDRLDARIRTRTARTVTVDPATVEAPLSHFIASHTGPYLDITSCVRSVHDLFPQVAANIVHFTMGSTAFKRVLIPAGNITTLYRITPSSLQPGEKVDLDTQPFLNLKRLIDNETLCFANDLDDFGI